jgi:DNA-binding NtrC family response regulator
VSEEDEAQQTEIPKGQGELVLLVEDEISILNLGKSMLEQLGYQVIAAATPDEMLSIISSSPCPARLLITDVVMPKMNGRELADRVKEIHPDIKCLFMSGYTSNIIAHQGVLDEGVHFMEKPFTLKVLATKVQMALSAD